MLVQLAIRDIVLIDKLELNFREGLSVLTGETGARKSILLDAFTLALGGRGDGRLVRQGEAQGQVTAVFDVPAGHPARALAASSDIDTEGDLILRRVQVADGRTRAFVNDQPVGVQVLRASGRRWSRSTASTTTALSDSTTHRAILDAFGGSGKPPGGGGRRRAPGAQGPAPPCPSTAPGSRPPARKSISSATPWRNWPPSIPKPARRPNSPSVAPRCSRARRSPAN